MWRQITAGDGELDLRLTLSCGQAFRWTSEENGKWSGAIGSRYDVYRHHTDIDGARGVFNYVSIFSILVKKLVNNN